MSDEKKIILITGQRGCGKSTISKRYTDRTGRLLVYDTLNNSKEVGVVIDNLEDLHAFIWQFYERDKGRSQTFPFRIIYRPIRPREDFEAVCELVYALKDMTMVIEELGTIFDKKRKEDLDEWFAKIIQAGRHRNIELLAITQQPLCFPTLLQSQAQIIYSFRQKRPADVEFMAGLINSQAEQVRELKKYEYIQWDEDAQTLEKKVTVKPGL